MRTLPDRCHGRAVRGVTVHWGRLCGLPGRPARNKVRRDPVLWSRATAASLLLPGPARGGLTLPTWKGLSHASAAVYRIRGSRGPHMGRRSCSARGAGADPDRCAGGVGAVAVQMAVARGARAIASASEANQDYLREIRAIPVLYGEGVAARVRDAAGGRVDAVFDVAGKTPVEELISLVAEPSQVLSIANFAAGQAGARVTGGGADSRPMQALAEVAGMLAQNNLVIKVQTFPVGRAAEAYRISQGGHVRGKLVLIP